MRGSVVGRYARFNEISAWLDQMIASHSDIASPFSAGKSHEGRPLKVMMMMMTNFVVVVVVVVVVVIIYYYYFSYY